MVAKIEEAAPGMIKRAAGDHVAPFLTNVDASLAQWAVDDALEEVLLLNGNGWRRITVGRLVHGLRRELHFQEDGSSFLATSATS